MDENKNEKDEIIERRPSNKSHESLIQNSPKLKNVNYQDNMTKYENITDDHCENKLEIVFDKINNTNINSDIYFENTKNCTTKFENGKSNSIIIYLAEFYNKFKTKITIIVPAILVLVLFLILFFKFIN